MLRHSTPVLRSFDAKRAKDFRLDFLGFELASEARFEDRARLYLGVKKRDRMLHLSGHYGDGCPGASLRIPVNDVGTYMAELRAKKFDNSRPGEPQQTPWPGREITIADPANNRLALYSVTQTKADN